MLTKSHIGAQGTGTRPLCSTRGRACGAISFSRDEFKALPVDQQCRRCLKQLEKDEERARWKARRAAT